MAGDRLPATAKVIHSIETELLRAGAGGKARYFFRTWGADPNRPGDQVRAATREEAFEWLTRHAGETVTKEEFPAGV